MAVGKKLVHGKIVLGAYEAPRATTIKGEDTNGYFQFSPLMAASYDGGASNPS